MKKQSFFKKIVLCFALLFVCVLFSTARASLVIEPALIKVNLTQKRSSGTFILKNTDDTEKRYRAKAVHFILSPKGGILRIPPDGYSLAEWIKFNPKEFVLPPKSSRVIRYSIIPRGKLKPRDYWCGIQFMPLEGAKYKNEDEKGRVFNITILSAILVPIYGFVDGTQFSGEFKNIELKQENDELNLYYHIDNKGTGIIRLKGTYKITDSSGNVVAEAPVKSVVIYPERERIGKVKVKKELPPDKYSVHINLTSKYPRANINLTKESTFSL